MVPIVAVFASGDVDSTAVPATDKSLDNQSRNLKVMHD